MQYTNQNSDKMYCNIYLNMYAFHQSIIIYRNDSHRPMFSLERFAQTIVLGSRIKELECTSIVNKYASLIAAVLSVIVDFLF